MKKRWILAGIPVVLLIGSVGVLWAVFNNYDRTEGAFFDAEGIPIHYMDQGAGEPVILVHGFAANFDVNWRDPGVVAELAKEYRVIALDNRGHGKSGKPADPNAYGLEMVKDVIRLMDHLELAKAHVVGYSMGGFITLKLLTMFPERLLSASPCAAGWENDTEDGRQRIERLAASLESGKGYGPLFEMLEPGGKTPSALKVTGINAALNRMNDPLIMAHVIRSLEELQVTEAELKENTVPTLSVVGSIDPLRSGIDNMTGVMQQHQAVFVEGGDHITTMGDERFVGALKDFLRVQRAQLSSNAA